MRAPIASRARARARFALGLRRFLRDGPDPEQCRQLVASQHARRAAALVEIFERGVYANPRSPYLPLLDAAGIEHGDVVALVEREGVEGALARLYGHGVRLSIDEFKGRVPIRRAGLELHARPEDFDNPLLSRHYEARTSGTRGSGRRLAIDLDLLAHEAAYLSLCLRGFDLEGMPFAAWRPVLPGLAGLKGMLRRARLGLPIEAWLTPYRHPPRAASARFGLLTSYVVASSRLTAPGSAIPRPRYVPLDEAPQVAEWLAERAAAGTPLHFDTSWSQAVRVCQEARDADLDLSGTFIRVGGEPATPARSAAIGSVGARFAAHYSMGEVGWIGIACPRRRTDDEVHVMTDKLAVIQPPGASARSTPAERALVLTTLLPSCPKLLINVDSGDHALLERRDCDCPTGSLGLSTTARAIASHEKLTTEGMHFVASEIAWLLEDALPGRLGGEVGDYQLVEDRTASLGRIDIVVDPAVRCPPDDEVVRTTLESLSSLGDGQRLMAEQWSQARTLRVHRRRPYMTSSGKQELLHVVAARDQP